MLMDALQYIVELGRTSREAKLVPLPENKVLVVMPDGSTSERKGNRCVQHDKVASLGSLTDWAHEQAEDQLVFHVANDGIAVTYNRDEPHDSDVAVFKFIHSAAFADLRDWIGSPRGVKTLVRGLRTRLHSTFDPQYLGVFKRLDFTRRNEANRSASHTGESMGKSVEMAAQSASGDIPETLLFTIKLYSNVPVESYDLRVAVDVNVESETVGIAEVSDCIEEAQRQTREELANRLKSEFPSALVVESV